ncbi:MAG: hypothetical protein FJ138_01410, partial [Deltaproteobacteria bacterium]|nr:hypothetical protein [Deltaproteobacteria bacterium]
LLTLAAPLHSACDDDPAPTPPEGAGAGVSAPGGAGVSAPGGAGVSAPGGAGAGVSAPGGAGVSAPGGAGVSAPGGAGAGVSAPGGAEPPPPPPPPTCGEAIPLSCASGTQTFNTADGAAAWSDYGCATGFTYPGKELRFEFTHAEPVRLNVRAESTSGSFLVNYLLFALDASAGCEAAAGACLDSVDTLDTRGLTLDYDPARPLLLSFDPRLSADATTEMRITVTCALTTCGDGVVEGDEGCDDGGVAPGDGCDASCALEAGFACEGAPSRCAPEGCGDGAVRAPEGCDDGNEVTGDGCDRACAVEPGYTCEGSPSRCAEATGDTIATAALAAEGVINSSTAGLANDYPEVRGGCGNGVGLGGADQAFAVRVPARAVLRAEVTSLDSSAFRNPKVWLTRSAAAPADECLQVGAVARWHNGAATEEQIYVVVDGSFDYDEGPFELSLSLERSADLPAGATCDSAIRVAAPATQQGDTGSASGLSGVYGGVGGACVRSGGAWGYSGGADQVFVVSVPAGQTLSATARPTGGWDSVVSIHDSCEDLQLACLSWADDGAAVATNTSGAARDFFVVVGGFYNYSAGSFSLSLELR